MTMLRLLLGASLTLATTPALAGPAPISSSNSFRIGDRGVLCTAQNRISDARFKSMFDRGFDIVCRDASTPVGRLYSLRNRGDDVGQTLAASQQEPTTCAAAVAIAAPGFPKELKKSDCQQTRTGLNYTIYWMKSGKSSFAVEGLTAYESALLLGLQSIVADKTVAGEITVATTNAGDPAALARVQAASLDAEDVLATGYLRTNEGSYAEASEFFEALVLRSRTDRAGALKPAEYLANQAMQQSNLGNRTDADRLFAEAGKVADLSDPIFVRLYRNLRAMHRLNALDTNGALAELNSAAPPVVEAAGGAERVNTGFIDRQLSQRLAIDSDAMKRLGGGTANLTTGERATLLDAHMAYLMGVAYRMQGRKADAKVALNMAVEMYQGVRRGRVRSMIWLVATADSELAKLAEADGNLAQAESLLQQALVIYQGAYPESATLLAARGQIASLQLRQGRVAQAIPTFRELVTSSAALPGGSEALRPLMKSYLDALIAQSQTGTSEASDLFAASQALIRPGVAQTQAVFARELSGGSDEASGLFRESVNMTRELVSLDVEIGRLSALPETTAEEAKTLALAIDRKKQLTVAQTALLAKLSAFPKFRMMSNARLDLADLTKNLREGEAYYKLLFVGETGYALFAQPGATRIFRLDRSREQLEAMTNTIRDSIVVEQNNQLTTNAFDVVTARTLYLSLFGQVDGAMANVKHLIFEPDGPLLKLPVNALITQDKGVADYQARLKQDNPDEFDFTGIAWLGRDRIVSTAVSAQSFVDVRALPPSKAKRRFLGVGQNTPTAKLSYAPQTDEGRAPCDWNLSLWDHPISSNELTLASRLLGGTGNTVITEADYSDTNLRERSDLRDYRVIQFATHGLVTAPRPGCPARPALVTSFGPRDSDGLLSFKEIFDLRFDADTVILSACDTAGAATSAATREAGITTGGNFALDGLVRAFVGAGARAVIASHWPIPDDYDATTKLMTGLFKGGTSVPVGEAMRQSQIKLMDDPLTSHPYYWAAFAIVGDASKPLTSGNDN